RRSRPKELPRGYIRLVPEVTRIPFMRVRLQAFALSLSLSVASVVLLFTVGPNFGIDFTGGTIIEVRAKSGEADTGDIRQRLTQAGIGEAQVQGFGNPSDALIRLGIAPDTGAESGDSIVREARAALEADYDIRRTEVVGPTVSGELVWTAIMGVLAALGG